MAKKLSFKNGSEYGEPHHFYASSIGEWRTGPDLEKLVASMKRSGLPFNLFYVPGPEDSEYKIKCYAPDVVGAKLIGVYTLD